MIDQQKSLDQDISIHSCLKDNAIEEYSENFISHTRESGLLSPALSEKVESMLPEMRHNFTTQTIWRTETEIRISVLNDKDFPTRASKYHQAKLEQKVFFEQLLSLQFDYQKYQKNLELKEIEIEEKELEISECQDEINEILKNDITINGNVLPRARLRLRKLNAELDVLKIESKEMSYGGENLKIQGRERVREIEIWSKIKEELNDGSFDIDSRNSDQLLSFTLSYISKAYDAICTGKTGDTAGYSNIIAQFEEGIRSCVQNNLLETVINDLINRKQFLLIEFVDSYFNLGIKIESKREAALTQDV